MMKDRWSSQTRRGLFALGAVALLGGVLLAEEPTTAPATAPATQEAMAATEPATQPVAATTQPTFDWSKVELSKDEIPQSGYTLPSDKRELFFGMPGIIAELNVKEGEIVRSGQKLATLDDREDKAELEALRLDSVSQVATRAAEITLAAKETELARVQDVFSNNAASKTELEKARLDRDLAKEDIEKAKEEQQQKVQKYQAKLIHVQRMALTSPIEGNAIVEKIDARVGELAAMDRTKPAYVLVKNDPLWVEVYLPVKLSQWVSVGTPMGVSQDEGKTWEEGHVIFKSPVADAQSGTQMVRLELPNPQERASGMQVQVKLPPNLGVQTNAGK